MTRARLDFVLQHIRQLAGTSGKTVEADAQLLQQFISGPDEVAFETLVRRHGPLVLGVCRRLLRDEGDCEDVFQATFLVLLRKAHSIRKRAALGSWLYGVAYRIARKVRARAARRAEVERPLAHDPVRETAGAAEWRDLRPVLDEELNRLPEKYRLPLVLCYLEGQTYAEAARQLGWRQGTVCGRLARARDLLRHHLVRRGVALSATVLTGTLADASAAVPPPLLAATTRLALLSGLGQEAAPPVTELARIALKGMHLARLKLITAVFVTISALAGGSSVLAYRALRARAPENETRDASRLLASPEGPQSPAPRLDRLGDPLPPGALGRLGTVRFRHEDRVERFALSPDGRTLACAAGKSVYLWDPDTGKLLRRVTGHEEYVHDVAYSADGKWLASGSEDNSIRLWDPATGKEVRRFLGHKGKSSGRQGVLSVLFAGGDRYLVSRGGNKTIRLWEVASGRERQRLTGPPGTAWTLAASPDGKVVGGLFEDGDSPGVVCLWEVETGKEIRRIPQPAYAHGITFSPDGKTLAVSGFEYAPPAHPRQGDRISPYILRLWDVATGEELRRFGDHPQLWAFAFSADGKTLVSTGGDATLRLWDISSGKELRRFTGISFVVIGIAFLPNDKTLILQTQENSIRLWDLQTGGESRSFAGHEQNVASVAISPDGRRIATAARSDIRVWDSVTCAEVRTLRGQTGGISELRFSPDGRTLVSASYNGTLRFWDVASWKELRTIGNARRANCVASSPDGGTVATWGHEDRAVHLWDTATGKELHHWSANWMSSMSFSPDSKVLAGSGSGQSVQVWDVATGKELRTLGPYRCGVPAVAFSPDGRVLAAAAMDHTITLWELATGRARVVIKTEGNTTALAFAPDCRWVASVNNGRSRLIVDAGGNERDVGNENKNQVCIWEVATGRETRRLAGHRGGIDSVAFSQDGKLLVSGSMDTTALVWDAATLLLITPSRSNSLTGAALESFWSELADADAGRAHRAVWSMAEAPGASVRFLKERLPPVPTADPQRVARLLTDLNGDRFGVREKARQELEKLGESVGSALHKAQREKPSLEVQRRIEQLLARFEGESLRISRAVEVLERIQSAEAQHLLQDLARGDETARLTREARVALNRLAKRPSTN